MTVGGSEDGRPKVEAHSVGATFAARHGDAISGYWTEERSSVVRNCKIFLLLLLFLFVFTACQSAEQPTPIPETPESIVEEPEPIPEEPTPIVEEPEPIPLPDPAAIEAKTQQASICPCLAVEHAQWNLARRGFPDYTGEPLNSVLAAFSAHVTENWDSLAQTYGDLVNGTLWIIDHDENGYYLQIIRFTDTAEQLLLLQWDGAEMTVFEESRPMENIEYAVCSKYCDPDLIRSGIDHASVHDTLYFHRFSAIGSDHFVHTGFYIAEDDPTTVLIQMDNMLPTTNTLERRSLLPQEQQFEPISPVVERLLRMDYSTLNDPIGTDEANRVLLQDYLFRVTAGLSEADRWDAACRASKQHELFSHLWSPLQVFMSELAHDPELQAALLQADSWEITGGPFYYDITATSAQKSLTVTLSPVALDSEDWITPSRKHTQHLADTGANSALIPEEVKADIVDFIMDDSHYGLVSFQYPGRMEYRWNVCGDGIYEVALDRFYEGNTGTVPDSVDILHWENKCITVETTFPPN